MFSDGRLRTPSSGGRKKWTIKEREIIETYFSENIKNLVGISDSDARQCRSNNPELMGRNAVSITSKINNIIKAKKK